MAAPALYDSIGTTYSSTRQTDPRWMDAIVAALGSARTVINVGAGTGSYEPTDRLMLAVEPSSQMIAQRPANSAPVIRAVAESLPLADRCADAVMTVLSMHHWSDWRQGLAELTRVAPLRIVLTADTRKLEAFWLASDYVPELAQFERTRLSADDIAAQLNPDSVIPLPLPVDFQDGVYMAFWARPEAFLEPQTWRNSSSLAQLSEEVRERAIRDLRADLRSGRWQREHGHLRTMRHYDAGFCLLVSRSLSPPGVFAPSRIRTVTR